MKIGCMGNDKEALQQALKSQAAQFDADPREWIHDSGKVLTVSGDFMGDAPACTFKARIIATLANALEASVGEDGIAPGRGCRDVFYFYRPQSYEDCNEDGELETVEYEETCVVCEGMVFSEFQYRHPQTGGDVTLWRRLL